LCAKFCGFLPQVARLKAEVEALAAKVDAGDGLRAEAWRLQSSLSSALSERDGLQEQLAALWAGHLDAVSADKPVHVEAAEQVSDHGATHSYVLARALIIFVDNCLSYPPTLNHKLTRTLSLPLTYSLNLSLSQTHSFAYTHTRTHLITHSHPLTHSPLTYSFSFPFSTLNHSLNHTKALTTH
jgi:hypothetical protein